MCLMSKYFTVEYFQSSSQDTISSQNELREFVFKTISDFVDNEFDLLFAVEVTYQ